MTRRRAELAKALGADYVGKLPHVGGGAFGAARIKAVVAALRASLQPGRGRRPGRPTNARWSLHPKVPMSGSTKTALERLADQLSTNVRKVSPMQVAAQLLEAAVAELETKN